MLTLYCSNKLQKYIGFKDNQIEQNKHSSLNSWNGHLFTIDRKKGFIFINDSTYFSFTVYPVRKADVKNLDVLFFNGLILELEKLDMITEQQKIRLQQNFSRIYFHKSINNRKAIALMNMQLQVLKSYPLHYDTLEEWLRYRSTNKILSKLDGKNYDFPKDWMKDRVNELFTHLQIKR